MYIDMTCMFNHNNVVPPFLRDCAWKMPKKMQGRGKIQGTFTKYKFVYE